MLSLTQQFLAWCRSKPADEEYDPCDWDACALGQFGIRASIFSCEALGIPTGIYKAAAWRGPFTFGSLAERVERQLVEQVKL